MGQTLYAIIAMMVVSLFSLQQQRHALRTQFQMIDSEIETIASSVAVERLEEIGAMAFDHHTKSGAMLDDSSQLTPRSGFGTGDGKDPSNDDLDDFDDTDKAVFRVLDSDTLFFDTHVTVDYALPTALDVPTNGQTKYKLVTVTVTPKDLEHALYSAVGLRQKTVTLSQTYSCKSACQW